MTMPGPGFNPDTVSINPTEPNPDIDLTISLRDLDSEVGSKFDWVNWPTGVWIDRDQAGHERAIDMPERQYSIKINQMLQRDGQAAQVFEALVLPLTEATPSIPTPDGDAGQADFIRGVLMQPGSGGGMATPFDTFIAQMAGACVFKRAYFEKVFTRDQESGQVRYEKVAWRPPGSCELVRDLKSGEVAGFRQYMSFGLHQSPVGPAQSKPLSKDGYMEIPMRRACVYIHGQRRNPIDGISSMDPAYWAYVMKQRVMRLWFTFLDANAQIKVLAYGRDSTEAKQNASNIARLKGGGVVPVLRPEDSLKMFDTLDMNGKGAGEFQAMIAYLDQSMTHSVLAGFLDLTRQATAQAGTGAARGSSALNQGSMDLFMESRHSVAKEMADCINAQIIAPLVALNYGPSAVVPQLTFEKISSDEADRAIALLTSLATAPTIQVPSGFVDMLVEQAAQFLNLDPDKVQAAIEDKLKTFPPPQSGGVGGPAGAEPAASSDPLHTVAAATDTINKMIGQAQGPSAGQPV